MSQSDGTDPAEPAPAKGGIEARVVKGASFLIGANVGIRLLSLFSVAILARILTPEDYGVLSLAMVAVGLTQVMTEFQINNALIRLPSVAPHLYNTAFTMAALRGVFVALVLVLTAGPVASLMGEPRLEEVLWVLALVPALDGLRNPKFVDFDREIRFGPEAIMTIGARVATVSASIILGFVWRDYWALVIGTVAASAMSTAITYIMRPYLPRIGLKDWAMFFRFGGWLSLSAMASFANSRADFAFIGRWLGTATAGQYGMGFFLATMVTHALANHFTRAVYPGLSKVAEDAAKLKRAYLKSQATIIGVLLPAGVGTALVAPELIYLAAGPQWGDAATVIQFIAPAIGIGMLVSSANALMMVYDNTRALFLRDILNLVIRVPLLIVGILSFGLIGALTANVVGSLIYTFTTLVMVSRASGWGLWDPVIYCRRSLWSALAMTGAILGLAALLPDPAGSYGLSVLHLCLKAGIGALVYGAVHYGLWLASGREDSFETAAVNTVNRLSTRFLGRAVLS